MVVETTQHVSRVLEVLDNLSAPDDCQVASQGATREAWLLLSIGIVYITTSRLDISLSPLYLLTSHLNVAWFLGNQH
jgi:hypothetical protein